MLAQPAIVEQAPRAPGVIATGERPFFLCPLLQDHPVETIAPGPRITIITKRVDAAPMDQRLGEPGRLTPRILHAAANSLNQGIQQTRYHRPVVRMVVRAVANGHFT